MLAASFVEDSAFDASLFEASLLDASRFDANRIAGGGRWFHPESFVDGSLQGVATVQNAQHCRVNQRPRPKGCQPVVRTARPIRTNGAVIARAPHTRARPTYSVSSNGPT